MVAGSTSATPPATSWVSGRSDGRRRTPARHRPGAEAHAALDDHLDRDVGEPGADPALPSLLPEWTRGHVLTHIARNADSFVRVLEAARRGEVVTQYEGGVAGRNADIEAGARP